MTTDKKCVLLSSTFPGQVHKLKYAAVIYKQYELGDWILPSHLHLPAYAVAEATKIMIS